MSIVFVFLGIYHLIAYEKNVLSKGINIIIYKQNYTLLALRTTN